jgi:diguanylate cyclase (GGDEF)-like protein
MSDGYVALGLNNTHPNLAALPHLERLLDLLSDALTDPDDVLERQTFLARIAEYREALHKGNPTLIRDCGDALLTVCGQALERHKKHRLSVRSEIADLIKLFREVTVSVAGEGELFAADMTQSATRFSALAQINDIRLLKDRLTREVHRLRESALAREQRWRAVVTSFKDKVESLEEQLLATQHEASLDPLTGVANRRLFDRTLVTFMSKNSRRFALVLIDVDDFKNINDHSGHEAGDRVLQSIAHSFATSVRSDDMVARIGGDEFALILENVTLAQACTRVSGIVAALKASSAPGQPALTVSCGVAEFSAGDTPQSLTKRADDALYEAKHQGKGRVVPRQAPLIRDLRRATEGRR